METILNLDKSLFILINQVWVSSWADVFFPWITDLHKTLPFQVVFFPLMMFIFVKKFKKNGVLVFMLLAVSMGLNDYTGSAFIKKTVARPRPFTVPELHTIQRAPAASFSFISNHSSNIFALATFTTIMVPPMAGPFFLVAAVVGYSRIYNGVHYPTDVFCGALFGILWAVIFALAARRILGRISKAKG